MFWRKKRPAHRNSNGGVQVNIEIDMHLPLESITDNHPMPPLDLDGIALFADLMEAVNDKHRRAISSDIRRQIEQAQDMERQRWLAERAEREAHRWANGELDYHSQPTNRQRVTGIRRTKDQRIKADITDGNVLKLYGED